MVDDLIDNQSLIGMEKSRVDVLLGPSPGGKAFGDYDYIYCTGPERGLFQIDNEWLVIRFENDKVAEAKLVTD